MSSKSRKLGDIAIESRLNQPKGDTERLRMQFYRHSIIQQHKSKIHDMKVDEVRSLLYTCAHDKKICVIDLDNQKPTGMLKATNAHFRALELNTGLKRLYASSFEKQVFIFNISGHTPILMRSFDFEAERFGYVKRIEFSPDTVRGG